MGKTNVIYISVLMGGGCPRKQVFFNVSRILGKITHSSLSSLMIQTIAQEALPRAIYKYEMIFMMDGQFQKGLKRACLGHVMGKWLAAHDFRGIFFRREFQLQRSNFPFQLTELYFRLMQFQHLYPSSLISTDILNMKILCQNLAEAFIRLLKS